jgi:S-adenosylmethionine-diacylglycerol 3-amino-3-carboxypropyl transferase
MQSEAAARADFSEIRYAQVWEDADILLDALDVRPGDVCVSIASAGDNALAMLTRNPAKVIAVDLSPAQLACLELRVAAFRTLDHAELLELIGSRPSTSRQRAAFYKRCCAALSAPCRAFWDARPEAIAAGIGSAGKFERYFALFRNRILPLVHPRRVIDDLLATSRRGGQPAAASRGNAGNVSNASNVSGSGISNAAPGGSFRRSREERERFYEERWNTWRWRLLFRVFFSRWMMGRLGRDPEFFRYVDETSVADRILSRTRHALTALDPADNPYIHWILTGTHGTALPCALRKEHFETIRQNLDRLEWHCDSLEAFLARTGPGTIDRYNLSDAFEYVSSENYHRMLESIVRASRPGARLAYWNMLVPRSRPDSMADRLVPLTDLAARLHQADRAFFYSAFVVEEVR